MSKLTEGIWNFFVFIWKFMDGRKTKIGAAFFIFGSYWAGADLIIQNSNNWRDLVPSMCLHTSTYLCGGAALHTKMKADRLKSKN